MVKLDLDLDPDPHSENLLDPDPHKMNADPRPCLRQRYCNFPSPKYKNFTLSDRGIVNSLVQNTKIGKFQSQKKTLAIQKPKLVLP